MCILYVWAGTTRDTLLHVPQAKWTQWVTVGRHKGPLSHSQEWMQRRTSHPIPETERSIWPSILYKKEDSPTFPHKVNTTNHFPYHPEHTQQLVRDWKLFMCVCVCLFPAMHSQLTSHLPPKSSWRPISPLSSSCFFFCFFFFSSLSFLGLRWRARIFRIWS